MITKEQKEFLLPKAYNAAIRAGAAILDVYNSGEEVNVDIKNDNTPITIADRRAHTVIREYLGRTMIPLLSEEGREMLFTERKDWDLFWIVDPLDGTVEFLKGNGEFTVNIALIADNKPVLGVIYVPHRERIYFSDEAMGAFRALDIKPDHNAEFSYEQLFTGIDKLPIAQHRNSPVRIAVSRSHKNEATEKHVEKLKKKYPDAEIIEQGSSYKLCLIAEGSVEYYVRTTATYEWDTAAGETLIKLAGGTIFSTDGNDLRYNKESLLNPHFHCISKFFKWR